MNSFRTGTFIFGRRRSRTFATSTRVYFLRAGALRQRRRANAVIRHGHTTARVPRPLRGRFPAAYIMSATHCHIISATRGFFVITMKIYIILLYVQQVSDINIFTDRWNPNDILQCTAFRTWPHVCFNISPILVTRLCIRYKFFLKKNKIPLRQVHKLTVCSSFQKHTTFLEHKCAASHVIFNII